MNLTKKIHFPFNKILTTFDNEYSTITLFQNRFHKTVWREKPSNNIYLDLGADSDKCIKKLKFGN